MDRFYGFAIDFITNLTSNILKLTPYEMRLCKQLLFPDGFCMDENKNVYTTKISPLYRLENKNPDSRGVESGLMVRMKRL